ALAVFLGTQRQVLRDVEAAGNDLKVAARRAAKASSSAPEAREGDVPAAGGAAGGFAKAFLGFMLVVAVALPADYVWRAAPPAGPTSSCRSRSERSRGGWRSRWAGSAAPPGTRASSSSSSSSSRSS